MVHRVAKPGCLLLLVVWTCSSGTGLAQSLGERVSAERVAAAAATALDLGAGYPPGQLDLLLDGKIHKPAPYDPIRAAYQLHAGLSLALSVALSGVTTGLLRSASVIDGQADRAYGGYLAAIEPTAGLARYEEARELDRRARKYVLAGISVGGLALVALGWSLYNFLNMPPSP